MKKLLYLLLLLFIIQSSFAQTIFAPKGAEWSFEYNGWGPGFSAYGLYTCKYKSDTIINGVTYKKIEESFKDKKTSYAFDRLVFLRQAGNKIFSLKKDMKERLLWTIGAEKKDTFTVQNNKYTYLTSTDSSTSTTISGKKIKTTWIKGESPQVKGSFEDKIYDYYAPERGFFFADCWHNLEECNSYELCTYKDELTGKIKFSDNCDQFMVDTKENTNIPQNVKIFPNPATSNLQIKLKISDFQKGTFQLYDTQGNLAATYPLLQNQAEYRFDISNLPNGMYFWHLILDNKIRQTGKIVVIKE